MSTPCAPRVGERNFGIGTRPARAKRSRASGRTNDADDQSVDSQAAGCAKSAQQGPGAAGLAAETRRLHAGLYDDAEEAEFGVAQGCEGEADQRVRGDRLYPWRGAQLAGALGGDDPWRPRQGSARSALSYPARCARYAGSEE